MGLVVDSHCQGWFGTCLVVRARQSRGFTLILGPGGFPTSLAHSAAGAASHRALSWCSWCSSCENPQGQKPGVQFPGCWLLPFPGICSGDRSFSSSSLQFCLNHSITKPKPYY